MIGGCVLFMRALEKSAFLGVGTEGGMWKHNGGRREGEHTFGNEK